jgi:hypothetical protein
VATFKKTEFSDARQFIGGIQNGSDLMFWVFSNGSRATHISGESAPEYIKLYDNPESRRYDCAFVGDWIMRNQDGSFRVIRPEELIAEGYEQV